MCGIKLRELQGNVRGISNEESGHHGGKWWAVEDSNL
jgi:hypothetical protein